MAQGNNSIELSARIKDWIAQSQRYHVPVLSCFLTEEEQALLKNMCRNGLVQLYGGCDAAIRQRAAFLYDEDDFVDFEIVCLRAPILKRFNDVTHRDLLGALMSLGLDRSRFGDCFLQAGYLVAYVDEEIADYVKRNISSVRKMPVQFEQCDPIEPIRRTEVIKVNVSSLRIDCVVAALANVSRTVAAEMIAQKRVSIDHKLVEETKKLCNNGNTISISGKGRFIVGKTMGTTRKDRMIVEVEKFV